MGGEKTDSGSTTAQGGSPSPDRGQEDESSGGDTDSHMVDWADTDSEDEAQPAGDGQGERAAGTQGGDIVQGSVGGLWAASTAAIAMGRVNTILAWNVGATGLLHRYQGRSPEAARAMGYLEGVIAAERPTWSTLSEIQG